MVENDVYETKKKFRKRDLLLVLYKMSSSTANHYKNLFLHQYFPPTLFSIISSLLQKINAAGQTIRDAHRIAYEFSGKNYFSERVNQGYFVGTNGQVFKIEQVA